MSGYIIHFDNETELAHYGVKGMKWKKSKKSVKSDSVRDIKRNKKMNKYSYSSTYINRLGKINDDEIDTRAHKMENGKRIKINGKKIDDYGVGIWYDGRKNTKLEKKIKKILNQRYNRTHAAKGKNAATKILAKGYNKIMKKIDHTKTTRLKSGNEKRWSSHYINYSKN